MVLFVGFCPADNLAKTLLVVTCRMLSVVRLHDDRTVKANGATGGFITQEFQGIMDLP